MIFNSAYDHPVRGKPLCECPKTIRNYVRGLDGKLEPTTPKNFYEKIQSYKEGLKIENIIKRTGGAPLFYIPDSAYVDTTNLPGSFDDVQNAKAQLKQQFEQLPEQLRKYYGSSDAFLNSISNGTFESELRAYFSTISGTATDVAGTDTVGTSTVNVGAESGASNV